MTDYTEADAAAEYVASGKYDNQYEDYRHAAVLAAAYTGLRAELARVTAERDAARQEAADWRLLAECCALRGVMQFLTAMRHINDVASGHDGLRFALTFLAADSHRGDITRSLVAAARRLADAAKGES